MGAVALLVFVSMGGECQPSDLQRFPCKDAVYEAKKSYGERAKYLELEKDWSPRESLYWQERMNDLREWWFCWDALEDALNDPTPSHLQRLRNRIGEANYAAGQMPFRP